MGYVVLKSKSAPVEWETIVKLDTGEIVAVGVQRIWDVNGEGIIFIGHARHVDEMVAPMEAPTGGIVMSEYRFAASHALLEQHDPDELAKEVGLIVLGEPPQLVRKQEYVPVGSETGEMMCYTVPIINIHDGERHKASIRHQIKAVEMTKSNALKL